MKHLTEVQLSAWLDRALPARERAGAERHLEACATCRDALAALATRDDALRSAITDDPGEAYFETFADRVQDRIARAGPPPGRVRPAALLDWLRTPRGLAWAGGVATIVVAAGVVLITARETPVPSLRRPEIEARGRQVVGEQAQGGGAARPSPAAPSGGVEAQAPRDRIVEGEPEATFESNRAPEAGLAAEPEGSDADALAKSSARAGRAREARRDVHGQELPVEGRGFAPAPPAPAAEPTRLVKPGARPLSGRAENEATKKASEAPPPAPPSRTARPTPQAEKEAEASQDAAVAPAPASEEKAEQAAPAPTRALARETRAGAPSAAALDLGGEVVCGQVRDASGRPVVGAQVALADLGRTTATDDRGSFCLEAPAGAHTLTAMAVGFETVRLPVDVAGPGGLPVQHMLTLKSVPVLEGMSKVLDAARRASGGAAGGARAFDDWPALARALALKAEAQSARAATARSAAQFDAAAADWERALARSGGGAGELEARRRLAEARYLAWGLEATPERTRAAVETLTAFVARAPAGAARDSAARWLDRVKR